MPRSWKKRGRDVPPGPVQIRHEAEHVLEMLQPRGASVCASSTVTLAGMLDCGLRSQRRRDHDFLERLSGRRSEATAARTRWRASKTMRAQRRARARSPQHESSRNYLQELNRGKDGGELALPAPYAGTNRIRFNGFAGARSDRIRYLRPFEATPKAARSLTASVVVMKCVLAVDAGRARRGLMRIPHAPDPLVPRRSCRLFHVDAFTRERFAGNPAVVVLDADELTDEDMHRIAREINGTEVAFVIPSESADHDLEVRFFAPHREVAFVGHATVAAQYVCALVNGVP